MSFICLEQYLVSTDLAHKNPAQNISSDYMQILE